MGLCNHSIMKPNGAISGDPPRCKMMISEVYYALQVIPRIDAIHRSSEVVIDIDRRLIVEVKNKQRGQAHQPTTPHLMTSTDMTSRSNIDVAII